VDDLGDVAAIAARFQPMVRIQRKALQHMDDVCPFVRANGTKHCGSRAGFKERPTVRMAESRTSGSSQVLVSNTCSDPVRSVVSAPPNEYFRCSLEHESRQLQHPNPAAADSRALGFA